MSVSQTFAGLNRTALLSDGGTVSWPWQQGLNALAQAADAPASSEVPAMSSSPGNFGQIATDGAYLYCCVGTNKWVRAALSTF